MGWSVYGPCFLCCVFSAFILETHCCLHCVLWRPRHWESCLFPLGSPVATETPSQYNLPPLSLFFSQDRKNHRICLRYCFVDSGLYSQPYSGDTNVPIVKDMLSQREKASESVLRGDGNFVRLQSVQAWSSLEPLTSSVCHSPVTEYRFLDIKNSHATLASYWSLA